MENCKNCGATIDDKFCPACGQKTKTSRITIRQVLKDVREHFIHFDKGFLFTIKALTIRPGHTIREYLDGKRVNHVKPLKFLVWTTALSFFITHLLGFQERLLARLEQEQGGGEKAHQAGQKITAFITSHPSLIMFLIIPTVALCSWLFFRKKKIYYAEYFAMNAFLLGQLSLFSIATNFGYYFWQDLSIQGLAAIGTIQWCAWLVYFGWAYGQFFNQSRKVGTWIKGGLALVGGYVILVLLMAVIVSTALHFFKPQIESWFLN